MDYAQGTDVSRYEVPCNYQLGYQRGLRFAYIRASVGDYYSDPSLHDLWMGYKESGCLVSAYLVTAPRDPTSTRRISATAHLDRFFNTVAGLTPDLPWVLDAELNRGETKDFITSLNKSVAAGLAQSRDGRALIYTRKSWWDYYVNADPIWHTYDLFPARYYDILTSPWSDGYCKFRDWNEWKFWQHTASANGPYWGMGDAEADLDYFNGTEAQLYEYAGLTHPLTTEDKVEIMWREIRAHHPDWNFER